MKPGDRVIMVDCAEADKNAGRVWTVRSEPWDVCGTPCVLLDGYRGGFAVDCLRCVDEDPDRVRTSLYPIVTLCGSTRFKREFEAVNAILTMGGSIVLAVGVYKSYFGRPLTADEKDQFDQMHLRKINMADAVVVIDVDGYIGESTKREIEYAHQQGKIITRLSEHPEWLEKIGSMAVIDG